jgi:hypothetical protein
MGGAPALLKSHSAVRSCSPERVIRRAGRLWLRRRYRRSEGAGRRRQARPLDRDRCLRNGTPHGGESALSARPRVRSRSSRGREKEGAPHRSTKGIGGRVSPWRPLSPPPGGCDWVAGRPTRDSLRVCKREPDTRGWRIYVDRGRDTRYGAALATVSPLSEIQEGDRRRYATSGSGSGCRQSSHNGVLPAAAIRCCGVRQPTE